MIARARQLVEAYRNYLNQQTYKSPTIAQHAGGQTVDLQKLKKEQLDSITLILADFDAYQQTPDATSLLEIRNQIINLRRDLSHYLAEAESAESAIIKISTKSEDEITKILQAKEFKELQQEAPKTIDAELQQQFPIAALKDLIQTHLRRIDVEVHKDDQKSLIQRIGERADFPHDNTQDETIRLMASELLTKYVAIRSEGLSGGTSHLAAGIKELLDGSVPEAAPIQKATADFTKQIIAYAALITQDEKYWADLYGDPKNIPKGVKEIHKIATDPKLSDLDKAVKILIEADKSYKSSPGLFKKKREPETQQFYTQLSNGNLTALRDFAAKQHLQMTGQKPKGPPTPTPTRRE